MKNSILFVLFAVMIATNAFATGENKISSLVLNNFKVDFKNVKNVEWSSKAGFSKASFVLDNRRMEVFYDAEGQIYATSTAISINELPLNAKRTFARFYDEYAVKDVILFERGGEGCYFIEAENEKETLIVKVDDSGYDETFKRSKK